MTKRIFDKHPQERFWGFLKTMIHSLWPDSYHELSQKSFVNGLRYMANLAVVSAVILAFIISLNLTSFYSALNDELTNTYFLFLSST